MLARFLGWVAGGNPPPVPHGALHGGHPVQPPTAGELDGGRADEPGGDDDETDAGGLVERLPREQRVREPEVRGRPEHDADGAHQADEGDLCEQPAPGTRTLDELLLAGAHEVEAAHVQPREVQQGHQAEAVGQAAEQGGRRGVARRTTGVVAHEAEQEGDDETVAEFYDA